MIRYVYLLFFFFLSFPHKIYYNIYELNDRSSLIFSSEKGDPIKKVNRPDKWLAIDKLQHFSYSCLISLGCQYVLVNKFDEIVSVFFLSFSIYFICRLPLLLPCIERIGSIFWSSFSGYFVKCSYSPSK